MRPNQNRRMRGRNRPKGPNPLTRSYESNGPDVKVRGTAQHIADKYAQLARDAQAAGDPVAAENYFQHGEHYFRIISGAQEQGRPQGSAGYASRSFDDDLEDGDDDQGDGNGQGYAGYAAEYGDPGQQPQPYEARNDGGHQDGRQDRGQQDRGQQDRPAQNRGDRQERRDRFQNNRTDRPRFDNGARLDNQRPDQGRPDYDRQEAPRQGFNRPDPGRQDYGRQEVRQEGRSDVRTDARQETRGDYGRRDQQREEFPRQEQPRNDAPREGRYENGRAEPQRRDIRQDTRAEATVRGEAQAKTDAPARAETPARRERRREEPRPVAEEPTGLPAFLTTPSRLPSTVESSVAQEPATTRSEASGDDAPAPKARRRRRPRFEGTEGSAEGNPAADGDASVD